MTADGNSSEKQRTPAIQTSALSKFYGEIVGISDLDLTVRKGEVFGFLGPNGAGKTTTIRLLLGLMKPTRGEVCLLGRSVRSHLPGILSEVGYLPGEFGLYGDLTGDAYLRHLLRLRSGAHRGPGSLEDLKARFEIDFARSIRTYSKGMRQIVGIIQAFAHDPSLLILDEPSSGLDPLKQEQFYELVREQRSRGKTIFFSSHVLREVERICDRVAIVRDGKLLSVQDVGEYRARLGKRVRVKGELERARATVQKLAATHDVRLRGDQLEFHYTGPVPELLRAVSPLELEDFHCEDPNIEDFFFHYYRDIGENR
jgi:ABC-2 type transport system ATP-binding protein